MTLCPLDGAALMPSASRIAAPIVDTDPEDSYVGLTLEGGISLVAVAGAGAMGTVYEGWQTQMERRVAVKMLHADLAAEAGFVERFMREARAIARLNHPNIVAVHAIGEFDGAPYLVMEFIEGETIADAISSGPLSEIRTVRIARQVTSALADAHAAGVIHRDLKPSNVLITQRRRASDFVKLLDFGVAKIVDAGATLTKDGFVFGTPAYLSPEQANGTELDQRSDLYSLGVCMFEMLSGTLPFSGNQVQLLLKHAREPAPPIRERASGISRALATLVDALLAKSPADRPESAEAVADALDSILGSAGASPWASRALPATRPPPDEPSLSSDAPTVALRAQGRRPRPLLIAISALLLLAAGAGTAALILPSYLPIHPLAVDFRPHLEVALPTETDAIPADAVIDFNSPTRAFTSSSADGHTWRIRVPDEVKTGVYYQISVDIWDPDGEPLSEPSLTVIFTEPVGERPFPATRTSTGTYVVRRRFDDVGSYIIRAYATSLEDPVGMNFEVGGGEAATGGGDAP